MLVRRSQKYKTSNIGIPLGVGRFSGEGPSAAGYEKLWKKETDSGGGVLIDVPLGVVRFWGEKCTCGEVRSCGGRRPGEGSTLNDS